ncbi:MAG: hypothetical protein ABIP20_21590 [Chthoniobacteraceae bacterium]
MIKTTWGRELYKRELAQRGIAVIYEHRLASVSKEGGRIRSITLDYAPPDKFGCPSRKQSPRMLRPSLRACSLTAPTKATSWRMRA